MKLYKLSFMALAMAGVLVACSDDDNYTEGPQSPGAYFASTSPKEIELSDDASTVNIPVRRTSASTTPSTAISVTGDTELFTFPSSVAFSGDELEANISVGYTATELEYDKLYNIEITVADDSQYGLGTYKFAFLRPSPVIEDVVYAYNPSKIGNGLGISYTYSVPFEGTDADLGLIESYNTLNPAVVTYTIAPWGAWDEDNWDENDPDAWRKDNKLDLIVDTSVQLEAWEAIGRPEGAYPVRVPLTPLGISDSDGYNIYIEDLTSYYERNEDPEGAEKMYGTCFLNPQTGLFTLYVIYVAPEYSVGAAYADGFEYAQLPGYPDYSLDITYNGLYSDVNREQSQAFLSVTTGPDFDEVRVVNILGVDTDTALEAVLAGTMEYVSVGPSEITTVQMNVNGPGEYTAIAFGFKGDNMVRMATHAYTISLEEGVVDNDRWPYIGECLYIDGWVLPAFQYSDGSTINPYDEEYTIQVREDRDNPGIYRLVKPYSPENSPVGYQNQNLGFVPDIYVNATDPDFVFVDPQYSGFDFGENAGQSGKMFIYDRNGYYLSSGKTKEEILESYNKKGYQMEDYWSYSDGKTITIQKCYFDLWGTTGRSHKSNYPTEIWLPGTFTPQEVAARRIRTIANQGLVLNPVFEPAKAFKAIDILTRHDHFVK